MNHQREINRRVHGASTSTLVKVSGLLTSLIAEVMTIIEGFREKYQREGMEEGIADTEHVQDSSTSQDEEFSQSHPQYTNSQAMKRDDSSSSQIEERQQVQSSEDGQGKGQESSQKTKAAPTEIIDLDQLPPKAIEEIASIINSKIASFQQTVMTLLGQSVQDSESSKEDAPIQREAAVEMLKGLFNELEQVAGKVPGVSKSFVNLLQQLLREPEVKKRSSDGTDPFIKRSNRSLRPKKTPPPPKEEDRSKRWWTKVKDVLTGRGKKKETMSEEEHSKVERLIT